MILSNELFDRFSLQVIWDFFSTQNRLHNIHRGLPTTNIIEPMKNGEMKQKTGQIDQRIQTNFYQSFRIYNVLFQPQSTILHRFFRILVMLSFNDQRLRTSLRTSLFFHCWRYEIDFRCSDFNILIIIFLVSGCVI